MLAFTFNRNRSRFQFSYSRRSVLQCVEWLVASAMAYDAHCSNKHLYASIGSYNSYIHIIISEPS